MVKNATPGVAEMVITGYIDNQAMASEYEDGGVVSSVSFLEEFNKLQDNYSKVVVKLINLYGGSVYEGLPIYSALKSAKCELAIEIHGLVASMGTVIAMAAKLENTTIDRYSRLMFHRAQAGAYGTADNMRSMANEVESLESQIVDIYSARLGKSVEDVKALWMDGSDHYITAQQAVDLKIVSGIIENKAITSPAPEAVKIPKAVLEHYQKQIFNSINKPKPNEMKKLTMMVAVLMAYNPELKTDASEDEVITTMQNLANDHAKLMAENTKMKAELDTVKNESVTALIDIAIKEGKIDLKAKESWLKMAKLDFAGSKTVLDSIKPHVSVSSQMRTAANKDDKRADWTFKDFQQKDPKALAKMKSEEPERFEELKATQYQA